MRTFSLGTRLVFTQLLCEYKKIHRKLSLIQQLNFDNIEHFNVRVLSKLDFLTISLVQTQNPWDLFDLHIQRTALTQMGHVMKMPSVRSSLDVITSLAHVCQCLWGMDSCANHVSFTCMS